MSSCGTWARDLLPHLTAGLMVVGYQDEESPGWRLLALAAAGGGSFDLPALSGDVTVPVEAHIGRHGRGAHASADELVTIAADVSAERVMLIHGERFGQAALKERSTLRGQACVRASDDWRAGDHSVKTGDFAAVGVGACDARSRHVGGVGGLVCGGVSGGDAGRNLRLRTHVRRRSCRRRRGPRVSRLST